MPAIHVDCQHPLDAQVKKFGWFEPTFKQESMFRQSPFNLADAWSDPSLPTMPNLLKSFANIAPRGSDLNETNLESPVESQGRIIRARDFEANEHKGLVVKGMTVLPITIAVFVSAVLLIICVSLFKCYRRRVKARQQMMESEDGSLASTSTSSLKSSNSSLKDMKPLPAPVLDKYTTAPTKITNLRQLQQQQRESQLNKPKMRQWTPGNSPIMPPVKPWMTGLPAKNKRSPKQSSPYPYLKDSDLPAIPPDALTSPTSGAPISYYSSPVIGKKGRSSMRR
ncbi:hypothetical protein E3Q24_01964 [Wallemia mellicola]|nr:hypothetical protein E3Q24_01964 [Wallemia mellicola]TIC54860.1 hypothetical protein E3Q04_02148 [Wallemia mellicola]